MKLFKEKDTRNLALLITGFLIVYASLIYLGVI